MIDSRIAKATNLLMDVINEHHGPGGARGKHYDALRYYYQLRAHMERLVQRYPVLPDIPSKEMTDPDGVFQRLQRVRKRGFRNSRVIAPSKTRDAIGVKKPLAISTLKP